MPEFAHAPIDLDTARGKLLAYLADPPELELRRRTFEDFIIQTVERQAEGSDSKLGDLIDIMLADHADIDNSTLVTKILRCTAFALKDDPTYPKDCDTVDGWRKCYDKIYANSRLESYFESYCELIQLQSNISSRYLGLNFVAQLLDRAGRINLNFPGSCNILDVGCSAQLGSKRLIGGPDRFPFEVPSVLSPPEQADPSFVEDVNAQIAVRRLLQRHLFFGKIIGIDLFRPEETGDWIRACSFEPDELMIEENVRLYDALNGYRPPNLGFLPENFATLDIQKFRRMFPGYEPQIAHFSSMFYECNEQEQQAMLARAKDLATELVVVQDYLEVVDGEIRVRKDWRDDPFPYRTAVIDMKNPDRGAQEILWWSNSRLKKVVPALGAVATSKSGRLSFKGMLDLAVY